MIVRVKTFSGENIYIPEEDYLEQRGFAELEESKSTNQEDLPKKKLSKKDKIALGTVAGGLGVAGLGEGYANLMKRKYLEREQKWINSRIPDPEFAKRQAVDFFNLDSKESLKDMYNDIKVNKRLLKRAKKRGASGELFEHGYEQGKNLINRKIGKAAAKVGLGAALAGGTYLGYKAYKNRKEKQKKD